jgi:RNA polymerase sigma-70 factor (ECF subfamily)
MILDSDITQVYNDHLPQLKSYLYRMTCDKEVVNDLSQDTFLKAIEKRSQFNESSSVKTWIFSIATNLAIDWLRKRNRWSEKAQDDAKSISQSAPTYRTH